MPKSILFTLLFLCGTLLLAQPSVETVAKKMSEKMYNPMDHGLESFSCKVAVNIEQPFPFSLTFSFKMTKGKEPEVKIIAVKPPEMQQFVGVVGNALTGTITQAFVGSFSDDILNKSNKVTVTQEKDLLLLTIESKKEKGKIKKLWLKDYIVVKQSGTTKVPDPMNPGSSREIENTLEYTWKETEEKHRVTDKVLSQSELGENELQFEHEVIEGFTLPKNMVNTSELGELTFKFSDYVVHKK